MHTHTHLINPDHVSEAQIDAFIKAFHGNKDSSHDYREAVRLGLIAANKAENNTGVISEAGIAYICNIFNQGVDHGMVAALEDVVSDKDMEGLAFNDDVTQTAFKLGVEQGKIASSAFTHFDEKSRKKLVHITGFAGIIKLLADLSSYSGFGTSVGGLHAITSQMVYGMRASGVLKTLKLSKELTAYFQSNNLLKEVNEACASRLSSAHLDNALKAISENKHSFSIGGDGDGGSIATVVDDVHAGAGSFFEELINFEYVNERPDISDIKATVDKAAGILKMSDEEFEQYEKEQSFPVRLNFIRADQTMFSAQAMMTEIHKFLAKMEGKTLRGEYGLVDISTGTIDERHQRLTSIDENKVCVMFSNFGFDENICKLTADARFIGPCAKEGKAFYEQHGDSSFQFRSLQHVSGSPCVVEQFNLITWDVRLPYLNASQE